MHILPPPNSLFNQRIVIADRQHKYFIFPADIIYALADDDYVELIFKNQNRLVFCMSLKQLMAHLSYIQAFCVVNRATMVNVYEIVKQQLATTDLHLSNGHIIKPSYKGNQKLWSMFLHINTKNKQLALPFTQHTISVTER